MKILLILILFVVAAPTAKFLIEENRKSNDKKMQEIADKAVKKEADKSPKKIKRDWSKYAIDR